MQKAALRRKMLQKRRSYLPEEITGRSQKICCNFFAHFPVKNFKSIHLFLPIASKNEVNTWFIVEALQSNFPEVVIAVPVTDKVSQTLRHYVLTSQTKLITSNWGIPEPQEAELVAVQDIDMILVPLLAFDIKGHRVGYGQGFYDRFLTECRPDTFIVGLSAEENPVPAISDIHEGDIALHFAVTPTKVYRFN